MRDNGREARKEGGHTGRDVFPTQPQLARSGWVSRMSSYQAFAFLSHAFGVGEVAREKGRKMYLLAPISYCQGQLLCTSLP